jgi:HAD superfamily hydrolase (TIGR01549 family)
LLPKFRWSGIRIWLEKKITKINSRGVRDKRLALFDLDGVLLDSKENMRLSWDQVRKQLGVTVEFSSYFSRIGRPFKNIMDQLGLSEQAKEIESVYRISSMENLKLAQFYPGALEMLSNISASEVKIGIVTSKDKLRTDAILAMLPITFASVRTPNPAIRGKPAPDQLLAAMAEVGVDPADTLYIGDMAADHEAAVRARVDYIHAEWGYGLAPVDGSLIVSELSELSAMILGCEPKREPEP